MIVKNPPRQHDTVKGRLKGPVSGLGAKARAGWLFGEGQRGKVMAGSVNPILRTCKVLHLNHDDTPKLRTDAKGALVQDVKMYSIVDLQVVDRFRPRYYVCNDLQLLARPEPEAYTPSEEDDALQEAEGNPIRLGGIVPARETVREVINPETGVRMARAGNGEYVLVSWSTENGKKTGWVRDPLTASAMQDLDKSFITEAPDICDGEIDEHAVVRWVEDWKIISDSDEEPVFGLAAAMREEEFAVMEVKSQEWFVETLSFVDMAYITRTDLHHLLTDHWPAASETHSLNVPGVPDGSSSPQYVSNGLPLGDEDQPGGDRDDSSGSCGCLCAGKKSGVGKGSWAEDDTLYESTLDEVAGSTVGGQKALERLGLMDHHLPTPAAHMQAKALDEDGVAHSGAGPSTATLTASPIRTTTAAEPPTRQPSFRAAPASSPRAGGGGGGGAWGKAGNTHRLRDITRQRMQTIIQPVRSFEDCAKRFDSIELIIQGVSKNVNTMLAQQAEMQLNMLAAFEKMRQAQQVQPQQQEQLP